VNDVISLERELDAIWIGTWKLQVNLPKYQRKEVPRTQRNEGLRFGWNSKKSATRPRGVWNPKGEQTEQLSFAQVVSGVVAQSGTSGNASGSQGDEVIQLTVDSEQFSWLEGSYVGCLKEAPCMQSIKESFIMGGFNRVRLRYLGERYVLLSCDEGEGLSKIIVDNKAWFDEVFVLIIPWDDSFVVKERLVWIRCRGVPLQLWCNQCFTRVGAVVGEVVEIDEATEKRETPEFARFRVKISVTSVVRRVKDFRINGVLFKVSFEEEGCIPDLAFKNLFGRWDGGGSEVDTEASSEEGSLGASICDSVDSELAVAGSGRVGVVGGGRVENEELVQGRVESIPLGMDETNSQEQLNGAVNVNGSLGFSKVENVKTTFNDELFIPNKASEREGRSIEAVNVGIEERGVRSEEVELNGRFKERVGVHVEGDIVGEHAGRGPTSYSKGIMDGYPRIGCMERIEVSGKAVGGVVNEVQGAQQMVIKEVDGKAATFCHQSDEIYEAFADEFTLDHVGCMSWVEDSFRSGPLLEEAEHDGVRMEEVGALEHPISGTLISGSAVSGSSKGNKLEEAEKVQRMVEPPMRVSGRSSSTQGEKSGLREDLERCEEVGGKGGSSKERMSALAGNNTGKQITVDQVFWFIKQVVSQILYSLWTVQLRTVIEFSG